MKKKKDVNPYIDRIMKLVVTYPIKVVLEPSDIQPIIDEVIDSIYADRDRNGSLSPRKHIISQALLKKFSHEESGKLVNVNGYEEPVHTRDWLFCLPEDNPNLWSQDIEVFFKFIETHGANALDDYITEIDSDIDGLTSKYTNPLASADEVNKRLFFSLYVAMHINRQNVLDKEICVSDVDFLEQMKQLTAFIFFHVWTWCKVNSPTFVVPVRSVVVLTRGNKKEYVFPVSPYVALFISTTNWESYMAQAYIFDSIRTDDELSGWESGLLCSSEEVGQQRFMIQNGPTSYIHYHTNRRLKGVVKPEEFTFSREIFAALTETIKKEILYVMS